MSSKRGGARTARELLGLYGPAALLVLAGFVLAFQFIKPAPPELVRIATGSPEGAYHAFARRYAEALEQEGIRLEVIATGGTVDNLRRLAEGRVDLAFAQGGVATGAQRQDFEALGAMYFEPLWLFHRAGLDIDLMTGLRGLRVGIGGGGSGTTALAARLLEANGLSGGDADMKPLGGADAATALRKGEIDAAFFVTSPASQLVQELLSSDGIALASFARAPAYARRYRYLSAVELPRGAVDLAQDIPARDISLLAPAAQLVANPDLHPAIIDLLLQAADRIHGDGGWFEDKGQFPTSQFIDFPLHKEAERFYKYGPPLLQRYLPFWAASLIDRLKVMLLPLIVLMLPVFKIMPPIYQWRMRSRVYRWYRELEEVDLAWSHSAEPARREAALGELHRIEQEVLHIEVPLSFADQLYHLRQHIDFVRQKINAT